MVFMGRVAGHCYVSGERQASWRQQCDSCYLMARMLFNCVTEAPALANLQVTHARSVRISNLYGQYAPVLPEPKLME
ncbi:hypothetical protein OK016_21175 [Vibrio chagasii]|nr:hypothetical protein [Vibrio chagasii]